MKDASKITLAVYLSKQSFSCLENEFARHFSLWGTQSSDGEIFHGSSAGDLAAILEFFWDTLMTIWGVVWPRRVTLRIFFLLLGFLLLRYRFTLVGNTRFRSVVKFSYAIQEKNYSSGSEFFFTVVYDLHKHCSWTNVLWSRRYQL